MPPTIGGFWPLALCIYSRVYKMPHVVDSAVYLSHGLNIHGSISSYTCCIINAIFKAGFLIKMVYSRVTVRMSGLYTPPNNKGKYPSPRQWVASLGPILFWSSLSHSHAYGQTIMVMIVQQLQEIPCGLCTGWLKRLLTYGYMSPWCTAGVQQYVYYGGLPLMCMTT